MLVLLISSLLWMMDNLNPWRLISIALIIIWHCSLYQHSKCACMNVMIIQSCLPSTSGFISWICWTLTGCWLCWSLNTWSKLLFRVSTCSALNWLLASTVKSKKQVWVPSEWHSLQVKNLICNDIIITKYLYFSFSLPISYLSIKPGHLPSATKIVRGKDPANLIVFSINMTM